MKLKSSKSSLFEESSSIKQILFDSAKESIILFSNDKIIDLNKNSLSFFNTDKKNAVGKSIYSLFSSNSKDRLYNINLLKTKIDSLPQGGNCNFDIDYTDDKSDIISLSANLNRIDEDKRTRSFILKFDKIAEQVLEFNHDSDNVFNLFSEQLSQPACLLDNKDRILKTNPKFEDFTGFNHSELESKKFFGNLICQTKNEESSKKNKYICADKSNNETEVEIETIALDDSNKIILIKDISTESNLREELAKARNNVTKIKNIFFSQISHEIRTPLSAILSFANLIEEEIKDKISPDLKTGFEIIKRGGDRIVRTINLILNMSEVMTDSYKQNPQKIDLFADTFHPIFQKYKKYSSDKCLDMHYSVETENRIVNIDNYMIEQIFSNLLDNAVKYTDSGYIKVRFISDNEGDLVFEIEDSGIGMTRKFQKKIFEPFTQEYEGNNRKYDGNGLGLALANKYCDICNIDMDIESNKNSGTTVRLVFKQTFREVKGKSSIISAAN